MTSKTTDVFYSYRYRSWDSNVYYGTRNRDFTAEEIEAGWREWETIDEQKYNEILSYLDMHHPCHYQVQKILCDVHENNAFDPRQWIAKQMRDAERERKHLNGKERKTIYLVKRPEPDNGVSPWLMITAREYENIEHRNYKDSNVIKTFVGQAHFGTISEYQYNGTISEYQYNGTTQFAFEFHPDYADVEPKV